MVGALDGCRQKAVRRAFVYHLVYLRDVFGRINVQSKNRLEEVLAGRWLAARSATRP